jgi:hypothetical protein
VRTSISFTRATLEVRWTTRTSSRSSTPTKSCSAGREWFAAEDLEVLRMGVRRLGTGGTRRRVQRRPPGLSHARSARGPRAD